MPDVKLDVIKISSSYATPNVVIKEFLDGTPLSAFLSEKDAVQNEKVREKIRKELIDRFGKHSNKVSLQALVCDGVK